EASTLATIRKKKRRKSNRVRFGVALNDQVIDQRFLSDYRDLCSYSLRIIAASIRGHQLLHHELIRVYLSIEVRTREQAEPALRLTKNNILHEDARRRSCQNRHGQKSIKERR